MVLFQGMPINELLRAQLQAAADRVGALSLTELSNPALAGWIEKLWAQQRPDVPVIFSEQKRGRQRQERVERDDYGQRAVVEVTYVDVTTPFKGDGSMFNVMPSTSPMIDQRIHVGREQLTCSLPLDDPNAEKINRLVAKVEDNLKTMRNDVETFSRSALDQLSRLAAERKARLEADAQKASKLGFPVD